MLVGMVFSIYIIVCAIRGTDIGSLNIFETLSLTAVAATGWAIVKQAAATRKIAEHESRPIIEVCPIKNPNKDNFGTFFVFKNNSTPKRSAKVWLEAKVLINSKVLNNLDGDQLMGRTPFPISSSGLITSSDYFKYIFKDEKFSQTANIEMYLKIFIANSYENERPIDYVAKRVYTYRNYKWDNEVGIANEIGLPGF